MEVRMTRFTKFWAHLSALILGLLLVNCAGTPNANPAKKARSAYEDIKDDSLIVNKAPDELREAEEAVNEVEVAKEQGEDQAAISRKVLLAEQQVRIAKKTAELRAAQDEVRRRMAELRTIKKQMEEVERQGIISGQIKQTPEERARRLIYFESRQNDRGLILRFKNIRFSSEGASLMSNAEQPINELADFLRLYPGRKILIEGHTDNTGSEGFNQRLSEQRANVVRDALISRGVDSSRVRSVGIGEAYPIASNDTEAGRAKNRRVDVVVSDENGVITDRQY